jgi:23S rRNA (adenine2503-C2)-methyltransferase
MSDRVSLLDLSRKELADVLQSWGEPPYRADQIWRAVYARAAAGSEALTELPRALRRRLDEAFGFRGLEVRAEARSLDGHTTKVLLGRPGETRAFEAVRMAYTRRTTLCISTQAGCAMGCSFCATGQMGFGRNLTAGEIVEQVLHFAAHSQVTNIVFMGMGEPFHNYEATLEAVDRLNDPQGMGFGARRMTISTVGLVPQIERFTEENRQVNLAVSLHAATDSLRNQLLPVNRKYPLDVLLAACRSYVEHTRRRISFEWALIQGINDGLDQAAALADRLHGLMCHVNLIPLNPTHGYSGLASPRARAAAFQAHLQTRGIACTLRVRRGLDIEAGCGQLAARAPNRNL